MAGLAEKNRFEVRITSLEEAINKDNSIRFIDAFVGSINLAQSKPKMAA